MPVSVEIQSTSKVVVVDADADDDEVIVNVLTNIGHVCTIG